MDDDALSGNDKLSAFGDQLKNTMAPPALSTWPRYPPPRIVSSSR